MGQLERLAYRRGLSPWSSLTAALHPRLKYAPPRLRASRTQRRMVLETRGWWSLEIERGGEAAMYPMCMAGLGCLEEKEDDDDDEAIDARRRSWSSYCFYISYRCRRRQRPRTDKQLDKHLF